MSSHNSLHNIETEAGPFPDGLGRKERVKDFSLNLRRHSRPVVHNLNEHEFWFEYRTHLKNLVSTRHRGHGTNRVVDQVRPNLVEFAAIRGNFRQVPIEFPLHLNPVLELMLEHAERNVNSLLHINLAQRGLIHIRIGLYSLDQVGDTTRGFFNFMRQAKDLVVADQDPQSTTESFVADYFA